MSPSLALVAGVVWHVGVRISAAVAREAAATDYVGTGLMVAAAVVFLASFLARRDE